MPVVDGQSAVLDLMESFGFEGGLEPSSPVDHNSSFLLTTANNFQSSTGNSVLIFFISSKSCQRCRMKYVVMRMYILNTQALDRIISDMQRRDFAAF